MKDELFDVFEEHLFANDIEDISFEEFCETVVQSYWSYLSKDSRFFVRKPSEVKEDLKAEVWEMLQKKIYGHFSIKQFRLSHLKVQA